MKFLIYSAFRLFVVIKKRKRLPFGNLFLFIYKPARGYTLSKSTTISFVVGNAWHDNVKPAATS